MARPEGVRIVRPDGRVVPCELRHVGYDAAEDMDNWEVVTELPYRHTLDQLQVDVWPPRTGLSFAVSEPDAGGCPNCGYVAPEAWRAGVCPRCGGG